MSDRMRVPGLRLRSILLVALSLSIGWGIRGNFGHEYGAMIAGALATMAACLLSGREDWRARLPYFAMFGALGWAFGGSMSYMQVIAYTHSGHLPSQVYGFLALFVIGFLWGGMGGAGAGFAAAADQDRLTKLFRPIAWVFGFWFLSGLFVIPALEHFETASDLRHESPLYWFDADWLQAVAALLALYCYDLWDRRSELGHRLNVLALCALVAGLLIHVPGGWWLRGMIVAFGLVLFLLWDVEYDMFYRLPVFAAGLALVIVSLLFLPPMWLRALAMGLALGVYHLWDVESEKGHRLVLFAGCGALAGFVVQGVLAIVGLAAPLAGLLVYHQGVLSVYPAENLMINWPQFFLIVPEHLGWGFGLIAGVSLYFLFFGEFRSGASLLVHMAAGWLIAFILLPALGGLFFQSVGGLRMTPPRSDDWAGILGLFCGTMIYMRRNKLYPVIHAAVVTGFIGGLGFSGVQMMKLVMTHLGNPAVVTDPGTLERWGHWQSANWHSWLEQTYGFVNGIGVAVALGLLATRVPVHEDSPHQRKRWTEIFAVSFVLLLLTYLNLVKNVKQWVDGGVQAVMQAPLFDRISLRGWLWGLLLAVAYVTVVVWFLRRAAGVARDARDRKLIRGYIAVAAVLLPAFYTFRTYGTWCPFAVLYDLARGPGVVHPLEFSAWFWFTLIYLCASVAAIGLMVRHARQPIALIPPAWLGRGQLMYLVFLWVIVIGNFERALIGFSQGRLLTEGVIFINAVLVTAMILLWPRDRETVAIRPPSDYPALIRSAVIIGIMAMALGVLVEIGVTRSLYGDRFTGHGGEHRRFGPKAGWIEKPILKGMKHR